MPRLIRLAVSLAFWVVLALTVVTFCLAVTGCASRYDRLTRDIERAASLTGYEPSAGDSHKAWLSHLEVIAGLLGVTVEYVPDLKATQDVLGRSRQGIAPLEGTGPVLIRKVWIDSTQPVNGRVETLAHELAHFLTPVVLTEPEREVFAEAVMVEFTQRIGLASTRQISIRYLSTVRHLAYLRRIYRREIEWAAAVLLGPHP